MLLSRDYSFKYLKTTFKCHLEYKFNFIISDAACGKTWLQKQILKSGNDGEIQILYPQMHRIDFTKTYDNIWFIDECDLLPILMKVGVDNFIKSPNVFLMVTRSIPVVIPVDYRAVFNWIAKDRHYTIKQRCLEEVVRFT